MNTTFKSLLMGTCICVHPATALAQENSPLQDVIVVYGQKHSQQTQTIIQPDTQPIPTPDAAALLARLPGADINDNGKVSGQVQYRGLFGPRLNVRIDGARFGSGGPGWMDPPLHYAPMPLIEKIELDRGVSPVRSGPGLGGGANAILKKSKFTDSADFNLQYSLGAGYRSVDDSTSVGGMIGTANNLFRFSTLFAKEKGSDIKFPGGTIATSGHERLTYGLSSGVKLGKHEFGIDLRRQETNDTGNPPFPMDIRYFDSDFIRGTYKGNFDLFTIGIELGAADIDHAMSNFHLRPNNNPLALRETFASAKTQDGKIDLRFDYKESILRIGMDIDSREHNVQITHPNNPNFFLDNVPDIKEDRAGIFAEWTGDILDWQAEIGGRIDWYDTSAGQASVGTAVPIMPQSLAGLFNASSRTWNDTAFDGVARFWKITNGPFTWRASLARKTRAPGYLDKFAWLPTTASAGLADGNIYVGDINIKSETAHSGELGFDFQTQGAYARPTVFYRSINNYIQGVAYDDTIGVLDSAVERVAAMNGDSTPLRFSNVDAKLYGFDMDFGVKLSGPWRIDGVASYVRGQRRDIDDNLYRVSPPHLMLSGSYEKPSYTLVLEGVFTAKQNNVSVSNSEQVTSGHNLFNAYGSWKAMDGVMLSAGIENLFNTYYEQHLAGYNRIAGSDVALGNRLPGAGRGVFIKLAIRD